MFVQLSCFVHLRNKSNLYSHLWKLIQLLILLHEEEKCSVKIVIQKRLFTKIYVLEFRFCKIAQRGEYLLKNRCAKLSFFLYCYRPAVQNFRIQRKQTLKIDVFCECLEIVGVLSGIYVLIKKFTSNIFTRMFGKTAVLKVSENPQKNFHFSRVAFKRLGLSNLSPITALNNDSIANVSCKCS